MTVENGVLFTLCFIAGIFGYFAFQLRQNENEFNQITSVFFFAVSLLFVNLIVGTLLLIVQNTTSIAYLEGTVAVIALQVVMWVSMVLFSLFLIVILFLFLKYLATATIASVKKNA
jgi:hypothetical protein